MAYEVIVTDSALADAEEFVLYLREKLESDEVIGRWLSGLCQAVDRLSEMPERCPYIPERRGLSYRYRHQLYASHRIVFRIEKDTVYVARIYHSARKRLR